MRLVFAGPHDETVLVRSVSGSNAPSTVEVRFEPTSSTERLTGEPTMWCNAPASGEPLVFNVPVPPNPGDPDTVGTLKVRTASTASEAQIRVKIKHEI